MKIGSIASGSSGNCIYIGDGTTNLLVDTGISGKRIQCGLDAYGVDIRTLDGILITHEHIDHVSGLGVLSRRYHIPIYATKGTIGAIQCMKSVGQIDENLFHEIECQSEFRIGSIQIKSIPISHDAIDPVAYRLEGSKYHVGIATDLGYYNEEIISFLQTLDAVVIEANHDEKLVQVGSYPYELKRRILGNKGHLSNTTAGHLLKDILHDNMKQVILGHLSNENNMPELAYETVRLEIDGVVPIIVAHRSQYTALIEL